MKELIKQNLKIDAHKVIQKNEYALFYSEDQTLVGWISNDGKYGIKVRLGENADLNESLDVAEQNAQETLAEIKK